MGRSETYSDLDRKQFADLRPCLPKGVKPEDLDNMRLEDIEKMSCYQDPQIKKERDERYILLEKVLASKL